VIYLKTCEITGEGDPCNSQIKRLKKTIAKIPEETQLQNYTEIFKAISDPTRLKILYLLQDGELCVCEIITVLEKPQSTISHHLNVLKKAGFIQGRKEGLWIHYQLINPKLLELIDNLTDLIKKRA
jgi:ArsR family transcriptional regulator